MNQMNDFEQREWAYKMVTNGNVDEVIDMYGTLENARRVIYKAMAWVQNRRREEGRA